MNGEQSGSAPSTNAATTTAIDGAGKTTDANSAVPDVTKNADVTAKPLIKGAKPDGITPEIQTYMDSQAAAARRAGEIKGMTTKEQEIETAKVEAQKASDLEAGKHKELFETEQSQHNATKTTLTTVQSDLDKLKAALVGQIPNPQDNYKRIVGSTYDEMIEDAKTLAASFGNNAHRDDKALPIVPNVGDGGKHDQKPSGDGKVTTDELARERAKYNIF